MFGKFLAGCVAGLAAWWILGALPLEIHRATAAALFGVAAFFGLCMRETAAEATPPQGRGGMDIGISLEGDADNLADTDVWPGPGSEGAEFGPRAPEADEED